MLLTVTLDHKSNSKQSLIQVAREFYISFVLHQSFVSLVKLWEVQEKHPPRALYWKKFDAHSQSPQFSQGLDGGDG